MPGGAQSVRGPAPTLRQEKSCDGQTNAAISPVIGAVLPASLIPVYVCTEFSLANCPQVA